MNDRLRRFLQAELLSRWSINPDRIGTVDGTRAQVAALLRECFGFSKRRASAEADEFFQAFEERLRRAKETPPLAPALPFLVSADILKNSAVQPPLSVRSKMQAGHGRRRSESTRH